MKEGKRKIAKFIDSERDGLGEDAKTSAHAAAYELKERVQRQVKQNFNVRSRSFVEGVKVYELKRSAVVRLSPVLSVFAERTLLQGKPNLWILLDEGERLGFKRISKGNTWEDLKRRWGNRLSAVKTDTGTVILFRTQGRTYPIYKLQKTVETTQKIDFYEEAEAIAASMNVKLEKLSAKRK